MRKFFLSVSFIVSVQVRIFSFNMRDIIIYAARWWDRYPSKHSLIKHTCSWRDKLIVLLTLNRQAKIFSRIFTFSILDFDLPACLYRCSLGERFSCALWRKCTSFVVDLQLIPFVLSSSSFSSLSSSSCSSWRARSWYICNLEKHQKISVYLLLAEIQNISIQKNSRKIVVSMMHYNSSLQFANYFLQ